MTVKTMDGCMVRCRRGPVRGRRRGARGALHGLILLAPTFCHGRAPVVVKTNRCGSSGGCLSTPSSTEDAPPSVTSAYKQR